MPPIENLLSKRYENLGKLYQYYPEEVPDKKKYQPRTKAIVVCLGSYGLPFYNTFYDHKDDSALRLDSLREFWSNEHRVDILNGNHGYVLFSNDFSQSIGNIYKKATAKGQSIPHLGLILAGHGAPFSIFGLNHNYAHMPYGLMWETFNDDFKKKLGKLTHPMFIRLDTGLFLYHPNNKNCELVASSDRPKIAEFDQVFDQRYFKNIYKQGYIRRLSREQIIFIKELFPRLNIDIPAKNYHHTPSNCHMYNEFWAQEENDASADIAQMIKTAEIENGIRFCNIFVYSCNSGTELLYPQQNEYVYSSVRFFSAFLPEHYILCSIGLNSDGKSTELYKKIQKSGQKEAEYQECSIKLIDSMIIFKNAEVDATFTTQFFLNYTRLVGLSRSLQVSEEYLPISNGLMNQDIVKNSLFSQIQLKAHQKTCLEHGLPLMVF